MDNVAFCFIVKDGDKYLEKNLMKIILNFPVFINIINMIYSIGILNSQLNAMGMNGQKN